MISEAGRAADGSAPGGGRADTVDKELVELGFSRQFNRKTNEGSKNPDRNAQFELSTRKSPTRSDNNSPLSPSTQRRRS
jgi:hypothetical protein